ncbi:MAG: NAD-dependent epimerase/dehydratase family protein, partial [Pirellulales bacterium]|nr:NAD-dependent epimerase/dehydratase family protein [Pirellulales bacterium]
MNNRVFSRKVSLAVSADEAFVWHERPGALERLIPPWENVRILSHGEGIRDGSRVVLLNRQGPLKLCWVSEHCDYEKGRMFRDVQIQGPFRHWVHTHRFIADGNEKSVLEDHVEYRPRGGMFGHAVAGSFIRAKIAGMFAYRHRTTAADLIAHSKYCHKGHMHVAVTGSHGLIGRQLVPFLTTGGHEVTVLVRGEALQGHVFWDPSADTLDASALDDVHGVVHLAGENIAAARWSASQKQRILDSREHSTRILCEGLAQLPSPPKVLVSASATGFYGDRGEAILDEDSSSGEGFLSRVTRGWEAATQAATAAGIRVVRLRFGVVLSPRGGALAK